MRSNYAGKSKVRAKEAGWMGLRANRQARDSSCAAGAFDCTVGGSWAAWIPVPSIVAPMLRAWMHTGLRFAPTAEVVL